MSKIPFSFVPIPRYFFKNQWFLDPNAAMFLLWAFNRVQAESHTIVHDNKQIILAPYEFVFGRNTCIRDSGLTERGLKTVLQKLKDSRILFDTGKGTPFRFTIYAFNTTIFDGEKRPAERPAERPGEHPAEHVEERPSEENQQNNLKDNHENDFGGEDTSKPSSLKQKISPSDRPADRPPKRPQPRTKKIDIRNHHQNTTAVVAFYDCLKDKTDLSMNDKLRLMAFTEEQVAQAIAFAYHNQTEIKKTRMHAIIFSIKNNIPPPEEFDPITKIAAEYNQKLKDAGFHNVHNGNKALIAQGYIKLILNNELIQIKIAKHNLTDLARASRELETQIFKNEIKQSSKSRPCKEETPQKHFLKNNI